MALTQQQINYLYNKIPTAQRWQWVAKNVPAAEQALLRQMEAITNPQQRLMFIAKHWKAGPAAKKPPTQYPVQVNEAGYQQQKADINAQYGTQLAGNDYAQRIAQQRFSRDQGDFNIAAARQREGADAPYLRRGIFNSGVRQQGLSNLRSDQARDYGRMIEQQQQELGQYGLQRGSIQTQLQSELNAVDRARQQAILDQLRQLQAAR